MIFDDDIFVIQTSYDELDKIAASMFAQDNICSNINIIHYYLHRE